MKLTVQDIFNFPELEKLTLIAGSGGLKKEVVHCGILDYEYDKDLTSKYYDYNYQIGGFFTLSTFLYAKNDPNLIYDAVKKLVSKKGSGLIIKNIFKLPISENVIRYANHMNFPIFILNDSHPFFEDIIILINKAMEKYQSVYYMEQKVKELFETNKSNIPAVTQAVSEINASMQDDILVMYFKYRNGYFSTKSYLEKETELYAADIIKPEDSVFLYKDGFMVIHSSRHFPSTDVSKLLKPYLSVAEKDPENGFSIGISKIHHLKEELRDAIKESVYASSFADENDNLFTPFDDLGPYQAILPFAHELSMLSYMRDYIFPLEKHDGEKNGDLLKTTEEFVKCGGDLDITAQKMGQHKNTIRYRLKRAGEILDLNPFALGDYERLALAVRIHISSGGDV